MWPSRIVSPRSRSLEARRRSHARGRGTVRSKLSMPCDRSREARRSASGLLLLLLGLFPTGIRVVLLHAFGENFGLLAEILLVHDSIRANDKCHHPGRSVLSGIRHESKTVGHFAVYDVAFR